MTGGTPKIGGNITLTSGTGGNGSNYIAGANGGSIILQGGAGGTKGSGNIGSGSYGNIILQSSNGLVGIGTASPLSKLDLKGAVTGKALASFNETGNQDIFTASASGTTKFVISNSGNVGIGTTNPSDKLSIYTTKAATPTSTPDSISLGATYSNAPGQNLKLKLYDDGASTFIGLGISAGQLEYNTGSNAVDHVFYQSTTELMRIKGSGSVGIGTASPLAKLDIRGAGSATQPIASLSGSTTFAGLIVDNSGSGDLFTASKSGAIKFTIANNGNVTINGSVTTCTFGNGTDNCSASDMRLKDNITPLSEIKGLDAVRLLNPVAFKWNSWMQGNGATTSDQFGFIAQDVASIFPNLVEQDKNTGYYKLDYQGFFAPLVKSIQELDVKVSSSGDIISDLALRVTALEQQATASNSASQNASSSAIATVLSATDSARLTLLESQVKSTLSEVEGLNSQSSILSSKFASLESMANQTASDSAFLKSVLESPLFTALTSSQSAGLELSLQNLDLNTATISGTLSILGRTTVSDLGVTGTINAGLLAINGLDNNGFASINTNAGALKLQSHGLYGLDILDGKVTIAQNGDITTKGEITAKAVNTDKLNITMDTTSSPSAILSTSAGSIVIPAGQDSIDVSTDTLTPKSLIFVTPDQAITIGAKAKDSNTFTIKLQKAQQMNIKVNWWLIN